MPRPEWLLAWLLRLSGMMLLLAFFAVFLPTDWMAAIHARLGLGEMPRTPLVEYLTRSLSALYAVHGGLMLYVSTDVRRHRGVIRYLGATACAFGLATFAIDLYAPMPWYWTVAEGPPTAAAGAATLWLSRLSEPSNNSPDR